MQRLFLGIQAGQPPAEAASCLLAAVAHKFLLGCRKKLGLAAADDDDEDMFQVLGGVAFWP